MDCHELDKLWSLKNTLSALIFVSWLQDTSIEGSSNPQGKKKGTDTSESGKQTGLSFTEGSGKGMKTV